MIVLVAVIGILGALVAALIILLIISYQKIKSAEGLYNIVRENFRQYEEQVAERIRSERKDAIARSTSVVKGKVAEQLVPFLKDFNFNPRDCRFIGGPVDLLVFEGLTEGDLERVVLIEVKTGGSRLSKRERQIRDAVRNGEFAFLTCRVAEDGSVITWSA